LFDRTEDVMFDASSSLGLSFRADGRSLGLGEESVRVIYRCIDAGGNSLDTV
jgi:hypothetical protein